MGMQFTGDVSGRVTLRGLDASDVRIDAGDLFSENTDGTLEVENATIESATVDVEADVRLTGVEVAVTDYDGFDPEEAINEALNHYDSSITGAEFEVTSGPTGFEVVSEAIGTPDAIEAYVALANAGFEVS